MCLRRTAGQGLGRAFPKLAQGFTAAGAGPAEGKKLTLPGPTQPLGEARVLQYPPTQ